MFKKFMLVIVSIILALGFCACGDGEAGNDAGSDDNSSYDNFDAKLDVEYAKGVIEELSSFGDDPNLGMRSAGSPAEMEATEYLKEEMKAIGLENVTVDDVTVDGWTFKGADIKFKNADGENQKIQLGGYQTTIQAKDETCELVYLGKGTEADYEGVDVKDKLVLIDVDQNNDWWINYPAYQAKVKGAKAVVAMSIYEEEGDDRIGVQDICGPADAPALAISKKDSKSLQDAIKKSGKDSIKVTFNADSKVTENATSHNVWGEIPGKTAETIFVLAHMDGYFHSTYDDAHGVATSMAIAKALIDSEYVPDKTIRFCIHGAEEWGREGSEYDWSTGAYEDIVNNHPEWVEGAFALVNNDGGYCVQGEKYLGTRSSDEFVTFIKESVGDLNKESKYEWSYAQLTTGTEDFMWTLCGIPSIVAGEGEGTVYDAKGYHSTYDSWEAQPLDEEGFKENLQVYGKLVIDLDGKDVRPLDFQARLKAFEASLEDTTEFDSVLEEGYAAAEELQAKMDAVEEGDDKDAAVALNVETQKVYKSFQDALVGLNFDPEACIRHELYQANVQQLDAAIQALKKGDIQTAYDENLSSVDWGWYYMYFDDETCKYMENQLFEKRKDTWGDGLIKYPHADLGNVVRSLGKKYDKKDANVSAEIKELKKLKKTQEGYLAKTLSEEKAGLEKTVDLMREAAK